MAARTQPESLSAGWPGGSCDWLATMSDDDPATGRRFLTGSAYADDRHLRARISIYAYAETAGTRGGAPR
jgi:hypothetical protein